MGLFEYWFRVCWRWIRGFVALIVGAVLSISIMIISIAFGVCYHVTLIGPIIRHKKQWPHPGLFLSWLHNAALWHICYKGILGMRFKEVDISRQVDHFGIPKSPMELRDTGGELNITLGTHPSTPMLFPYCYFEQRRSMWTVISVKHGQLGNLLGWAAYLCGAFVFLKRSTDKNVRAQTLLTLRNSVLTCVSEGVGLIIFGDAHRFTKKRQEELRKSPRVWLKKRANQLQYVLPERYAGLRAVLQQAEESRIGVNVRICTLFTTGQQRTFLGLRHHVGQTIYMFTANIRMTSEHAPAQMKELWDEFERIGKNPAHYADQLRQGLLRPRYFLLRTEKVSQG